MSYASSAGRNGKTCRQDVLRGVDVPVMPGAARGTRPVPRGQAQLREQVPARRAGPGTWVPAADHDQVAPGALAFAGELVAEFAPAAVRDGLCELAVADHVLDGKIFDHDHVVVADRTGAGTVQEITPGVADLAVGPGDLRPGLSPVGGAALAAEARGACPEGFPPRCAGHRILPGPKAGASPGGIGDCHSAPGHWAPGPGRPFP